MIRSVVSFYKRVRGLVYQLLIHSLDVLYDLFRYLKFSNSFCRSTRDRQKLESLLFFYYHKIEKALALPEVKPLFGLGYIETLLNLMERWVDLAGDTNAAVFRGAYASLLSYREHVGESLAQERPDITQRIDKFLADYEGADLDASAGGTTRIIGEELQAACQDVDLDRLVYHRHSVRNFVERHIPDGAIVHAVELAQQSPSVCNRQCWRAHVFTSEIDKARVLQHQDGNVGFGHLADRVLLITADLRTFVSSGERHQAYVDAGMFAMTLLYALQAQGIASCCLNRCVHSFQDVKFRRVCKIPAWEVPVMMIAIGYPPESLRVTISLRVPTESVLFFRDLAAGVPGSSH